MICSSRFSCKKTLAVWLSGLHSTSVSVNRPTHSACCFWQHHSPFHLILIIIIIVVICHPSDGTGKHVNSDESKCFSSLSNQVKESKCVIPSFSQIDKLSQQLYILPTYLRPIFSFPLIFLVDVGNWSMLTSANSERMKQTNSMISPQTPQKWYSKHQLVPIIIKARKTLSSGRGLW